MIHRGTGTDHGERSAGDDLIVYRDLEMPKAGDIEIEGVIEVEGPVAEE